MKYTIFTLMMISSFHAIADDWFCKSQTSKRVGQYIYACGIGYGATEDAARSKAFDASRIEFNKTCDLDADCKDHELVVDPMRTECNHNDKNQFKCYRLVAFAPRSKARMKRPIIVENQKPAVRWAVGNARLYLNMTKQQMIMLFGQPSRKEHNPSEVIYYYTGDICDQDLGKECYALFSSIGLSSWAGFNPEIPGA